VYLIAWYGDKFFAGWHPVILGVVIIGVMLFMPSGIMGIGENINHIVWKRSPRP
jgi:ABC-type branched-subunit amino acid transport system permease subunit